MTARSEPLFDKAVDARDRVAQVMEHGLAALSEEEFAALQRAVSGEALRRTEIEFVAALKQPLADELVLCEDMIAESGPVEKVVFHTTDYENGFYFAERSPRLVFRDGSEVRIELEDPDNRLEMASANFAVHYALGSHAQLTYWPETGQLAFEG